MSFEADDSPGFSVSVELVDRDLAVVRAFDLSLGEDVGDTPGGYLFFADDQFHKLPQGCRNAYMKPPYN